MDKNLRMIPFGGCGEVGMNFTIYQLDDRYYFVDAGALFPDDTLPGVDLILPDVSYLLEQGIKPTAWLITHGHEDHIGALPYLYRHFPAPIYSSAFTVELIRGKFLEAHINGADIKVWGHGQTVALHNLKVTPISVNHSIPHACSLFFETPYGNIVHTGDYRIDRQPFEGKQTPEFYREVIGNKPVKFMFADSTNSLVAGSDENEKSLKQSFVEICMACEGAVIVTTFASNIWRFQNVVDAAVEAGRRVYLIGRSMKRNLEVALKVGVLKIPEGVLVEDDDLPGVPKSQLCILCTGSQGEPYSGASRLAFGTFGNFSLTEKDCVVFSSRPIPGNEKSIGTLVNQFERLGADVITPRDKKVHVSGHGFQEDLRICIQTVSPEYFVPAHGEYRQLRKHIELATSCGIPRENCFLIENGDSLVMGPKVLGIVERVKTGRQYVFQGGVFHSKSEIFRARLGIMRNGLLVISFVLFEGTYDWAAKPVVLNKGVPIEEDTLLPQIGHIYEQTMQSFLSRKKGSDAKFADELRLALRRMIETKINYKCIVAVVLHRTY
jgi:ribonuclease J